MVWWHANVSSPPPMGCRAKWRRKSNLCLTKKRKSPTLHSLPTRWTHSFHLFSSPPSPLLLRFKRTRPDMMNVLEHLLHFQHFQQFISARLTQANSNSAVVYRDLFDQEMQAFYDGEGVERGRGEGVETGQGEGVETGQGEGVETGQGVGVETGQGEGVETGQGEGVETGQGVGVETGQGVGVETGQGVGVETGQGEGVETGQGEGVETGQGEGVETGQGEGVERGQGEGVGRERQVRGGAAVAVSCDIAGPNRPSFLFVPLSLLHRFLCFLPSGDL